MRLLEVTQEDIRLISMLLEDRDRHNRKTINTSKYQSQVNSCANEHIQINMLLEKLNRLMPKEYYASPYVAIWEHAKPATLATPKDTVRVKAEGKEITEAKNTRDGMTININIEKYITEPKSYDEKQMIVDEVIKYSNMVMDNLGFNVNVNGKRVCKEVL